MAATVMERVMTRAWIGLIALCAIAPRIASAGSDAIIFGVFPRWNAQITVRNFTPLGELLTRELGRPVRIETDKDFNSFMRRVYAREFDIVHLNQSQYIFARNKAGYRVIAKTCDNPACTIRAVIVARRDSPYTRIGDLKGKTVAFGDPGAMVSYILARSVLSDARLDPGQYKTIFTKNPPNALLAVYNGGADAAGVGLAVLQQPEITRRIDIRQLRILAESRPIPHLPVAVRGDLDEKLALRIQRLLTGLSRQPEGRWILGKIGIERFEMADDGQYASVKKMVEEHIHAH
jgi:phosphonate transport system substrate-binding protein